MSDLETRLNAIGRLKKLMRLAENNPNSHEAAVARATAERIATIHDVDLTKLDDPIAVRLVPVDKYARMREMAAASQSTIRKAAPHNDVDDYSKYTKEEDQ